MFTLYTIYTLTYTDVTGGYGQLNIQGPKSRAFMQHLVDGTFPGDSVYSNKHMVSTTSMSNEEFPFRHAKDMAIGECA